MDNNSQFLATLQEKERTLDKQLNAIRTTIEVFKSEHSPNGIDDERDEKTGKTDVPKTYEEATTWNSKVLFALGKIQTGFVQDMVDEILKHSNEYDKETLFKRITGYASGLKAKKILGAKTVGNRYKYFIK